MEKKTVRDINVKGKKVLVRVDYNVPMNDKGKSPIPFASMLPCRR